MASSSSPRPSSSCGMPATFSFLTQVCTAWFLQVTAWQCRKTLQFLDVSVTVYGYSFSCDMIDLYLDPCKWDSCTLEKIMQHTSQDLETAHARPRSTRSGTSFWAIQGNAAHIQHLQRVHSGQCSTHHLQRAQARPCSRHPGICSRAMRGHPAHTCRHRGLQTLIFQPKNAAHPQADSPRDRTHPLLTSQAVSIWSKHVPEMGHTGRPVTVSMILSVQLGPHTWAQPHCLHMCTSCRTDTGSEHAWGVFAFGCTYFYRVQTRAYSQQYQVAAWRRSPVDAGDSASRSCAGPTGPATTPDGCGNPAFCAAAWAAEVELEPLAPLPTP